MTTIKPSIFRDRSAIVMENKLAALTVYPGGGHIASYVLKTNPINPLWEPVWPGIEPSVREIGSQDDYGSEREGVMLSSIAGHNLCCDVFGEHSDGEKAVGLDYHSEAGMVHWSVVSADPEQGILIMEASLPHTAVTIDREFRLAPDATQVVVEQTELNNVGFERAVGTAQHATLGHDFLGSVERPTLFACNADKGQTWPEPNNEYPYSFKVDEPFDYPNIPSLDGSVQDWRCYPRHEPTGDLATLRIRPDAQHAWVSAYQPQHELVLAYAWEREAYPWMLTWEENKSRDHKPWNGKSLTRGLEFSSYPFATSRRANVNLGELHDTPTFAWLDAYAERQTTFAFGLFQVDEEQSKAPDVSATDEWQLQLAW